MKLLSNLILAILLVFIFAVPLQSQMVDKQIVDYLFNAQLEQADSLIEIQINKNPDHPKYYFLKTQFTFYKRYFAGQPLERDSILQVIIDYAQKAVDFEDKVEETTENMFYLGSAYGFLSRAHTLKGEYWSGYWAARDCRGYLNEVLEEDPQFYDAYVGLGVLEYYTGRLTGFQSFLAWLGGMSGDRELGLEYFEKAAQNGKLLKNEAMFILATLYRFYENDFSQAAIYLSKLNENFPDNNFITNIHRQTRVAQLIEDRGVIFLESGIDSLRNEYNITNSGVLNNLAYGYMGQEQYELAIDVFELNIKLYPDEANPYDSISECFQNQGNNEMAVKFAKIGLTKLPADTTLNDNFREQLKEIMETRVSDLGTDNPS
jgi:tetratricopeptide (TPR) repeat protein